MPDPRLLRVFLCHSSGDKPTVRELYEKLNGESWMDAWLDEEKLLPGQDWEYEIEKALDNSDAVIVTLSTGSVSKEGYVQRELKFVLDIALEKPEGTIFILPVRLDDCERPRRLRTIQGIDYFPPERREWAHTRLLSSLKLRAINLNIITTPVDAKHEPPQHTPEKKKQKPRPKANTRKKISTPKIPAEEPAWTSFEEKISTPKIPAEEPAWTSFDGYFGDIRFIEIFPDDLQDGINIPYNYFISTFPVAPNVYAEYVKAKGIKKTWSTLFSDPTDYFRITPEESKKFLQWLNEASKLKADLPPGLILRFPTTDEWTKYRNTLKAGGFEEPPGFEDNKLMFLVAAPQ